MLRQVKSALRYAVLAAVFMAAVSFRVYGLEQELKTAKDCRRLDARIVKQLGVPRCYHEGLYYDGKAMWLSNGEGGSTWVIDVETGKVLSEIAGVGDFTEAITAKGDGTFYTTEWHSKGVYNASLADGKLVAGDCVSVEPAHPAGAVWTGKSLYVITWDRGVLGTKFSLLEMDGKMKVLRKVPIKAMQEPCQLAWDGTHLWMTSWYDQRVYKIDIKKMEVVGYFCSPVERTTGVAWDGKYLWLTATYGDLYQVDVGS